MPDDTIMELVDNIESLYNDKMALFDRWLAEGDAWEKPLGRLQARRLARSFATELREGGYIQGRYRQVDIDQARDEMIEEFEEHKEQAIKAAVERPRTPTSPPPMTPTQIEHAEKCDTLAKDIGIDLLKDLVPATQERIRKSLETGDPYLNTIPLRKWDAAAASIPKRGLSLSEKVCALKHVATWYYV